MSPNRRDVLKLAAVGAAGALFAHSTVIRAARAPAIRAVAFDAFPVFDPRPVFALAETLFPGKGATLGNAWRTRQFEYQWLRALSGRYADFRQATEDGLRFAARQLQMPMTDDQREQLVDAYSRLQAWPDVPAALRTLSDAGLRLVFLSNMTEPMLHANLANAGIADYFDEVISTARARTFKPDPRAYQLGVDVLGLRREGIAFAAFAGWDVAGAKWFGYPTFWVKRAGMPEEELGVAADGHGSTLDDLVAFVGARVA